MRGCLLGYFWCCGFMVVKITPGPPLERPMPLIVCLYYNWPRERHSRPPRAPRGLLGGTLSLARRGGKLTSVLLFPGLEWFFHDLRLRNVYIWKKVMTCICTYSAMPQQVCLARFRSAWRHRRSPLLPTFLIVSGSDLCECQTSRLVFEVPWLITIDAIPSRNTPVPPWLCLVEQHIQILKRGRHLTSSNLRIPHQ
jgi:hypothetical protein